MQSWEPVEVLSISGLEADHDFLRRLFGRSKWNLVAARSCVEGLRLLRRNPLRVIVCERDLPDGRWRDLWDSLASLSSRPPLIVTSLHADNCLWAEVLNLGGYDVLAKPLAAQEVLRVVTAAWERIPRQAAPVRAA